jgi:hypothetical protein
MDHPLVHFMPGAPGLRWAIVPAELSLADNPSDWAKNYDTTDYRWVTFRR